MQQELDSVSDMCEFPSIHLMGKYNANNLKLFKKAAKESEEIMLKELKRLNINIQIYQSIDEFKLNF